MKMLASVGPSSVNSPGLMPSRFTTGTTPPMIIGNCTQTGLLEVVRLQRHVGGAERHGLGLDLLDAAARADRLVVEADAGLLLVGIRPFRVDRIRERRAGSRDVASAWAALATSATAAPSTALRRMVRERASRESPVVGRA